MMMHHIEGGTAQTLHYSNAYNIESALFVMMWKLLGRPIKHGPIMSTYENASIKLVVYY